MKDGMDKRFVGPGALLMRPKEIILQQKKAICVGKRHRGTLFFQVCISGENTHRMQKRESWKKIPSAQREISDEEFL